MESNKQLTYNPHVRYLDMNLIKKWTEMPTSAKQQEAISFYNNFFRSCGICKEVYQYVCFMRMIIICSIRDLNWDFCQECNCSVCDKCDCSIYHLDYQLALWEDVYGEVLFSWCRVMRRRQRPRRNQRRKRTNSKINNPHLLCLHKPKLIYLIEDQKSI